MEFPNASNVAVNMMYPADFSYWEKLKAFIDYEPVEALAPEARGALASIGIIKDIPFNPDAAAKDALTRAVSDAPKMIYAQRILGRPDKRDYYYSDRQYLSSEGRCNDEQWHIGKTLKRRDRSIRLEL